MPYKAPKKVKGGWILPKVAGGIHRSSAGNIVKFKSKKAAQAAARIIMSKENG